jgi:aspartyl-tRNA(Asn)/glutamyl-tRNA(Gln) amidotransferase subunit A
MSGVVATLGAALRSGRETARSIALRALADAEARRGLNAFLHLDASAVLAAADTADRELTAGRDLGPLHGIPVAIKDNMAVAGQPLTCASRFLDGYLAPYDATVVARLRGAGAVLFGKTNLDEFAMGSSNENSAFGPVLHPQDPSRVPGGSSGGSAAAVAAGIVPLALGSDTGGSVRQPASLCGVVGVKPTYGRVSRHGLVAFASSLDQVGPLAPDVRSAAALLEAIAGPDEFDATTLSGPMPDCVAACDGPHGHLRLGVPREYLSGLSAAGRSALDAVVATMPDVEVVEISLPHTEFAVPAYYVIASAEASSNLARFDGVRYGQRAPSSDLQELYFQSRTLGFGPEVKRRIMLGTFALSSGYYDAYYGKACDARDAITEDFDAAFANVDLVLGPTSPTTAFRLGDKADDPLAMYLSDIFTIPANLAGLPGISVPGLRDGDGLPWGIHLVAPHGREDTMFAAAVRVEDRVRAVLGTRA